MYRYRKESHVASWLQTGGQPTVGLGPPGHLPGGAPDANGGHTALRYQPGEAAEAPQPRTSLHSQRPVAITHRRPGRS